MLLAHPQPMSNLPWRASHDRSRSKAEEPGPSTNLHVARPISGGRGSAGSPGVSQVSFSPSTLDFQGASTQRIPAPLLFTPNLSASFPSSEARVRPSDRSITSFAVASSSRSRLDLQPPPFPVIHAPHYETGLSQYHNPPERHNQAPSFAFSTRPPPLRVAADDREVVASHLLAEKRRRNAGASARFRDRRKNREKEMDNRCMVLEDRVRELEDHLIKIVPDSGSIDTDQQILHLQKQVQRLQEENRALLASMRQPSETDSKGRTLSPDLEDPSLSPVSPRQHNPSDQEQLESNTRRISVKDLCSPDVNMCSSPSVAPSKSI